MNFARLALALAVVTSVGWAKPANAEAEVNAELERLSVEIEHLETAKPNDRKLIRNKRYKGLHVATNEIVKWTMVLSKEAIGLKGVATFSAATNVFNDDDLRRTGDMVRDVSYGLGALAAVTAVALGPANDGSQKGLALAGGALSLTGLLAPHLWSESADSITSKLIVLTVARNAFDELRVLSQTFADTVEQGRKLSIRAENLRANLDQDVIQRRTGMDVVVESRLTEYGLIYAEFKDYSDKFAEPMARVKAAATAYAQQLRNESRPNTPASVARMREDLEQVAKDAGDYMTQHRKVLSAYIRTETNLESFLDAAQSSNR